VSSLGNRVVRLNSFLYSSRTVGTRGKRDIAEPRAECKSDHNYEATCWVLEQERRFLFCVSPRKGVLPTRGTESPCITYEQFIQLLSLSKYYLRSLHSDTSSSCSVCEMWGDNGRQNTWLKSFALHRVDNLHAINVDNNRPER